MTHAQAIAKAHEALATKMATATACPWRLAYHFAAPAGWINDPNGLIHYRGEYHLFYQHHPYSARWGPMHWGHATSSDLLHWRHLPIALAPTEAYELSGDACGCFSGSAVERDGRLILMYTGDSPAYAPRETQCIATSTDGIVFEKHPCNPVINAYPPEGSADFRDPRIWRHGDYFYVVIGTSHDGMGRIVLYRSRDLANWEYLNSPVQSDGTQGKMWECPDLFELDGQHVLIFSPTGLGRPLSMYMVGQLDYVTHKFTASSSGLLDHGSDFYAPQTMLGAEGQRLMIGWMQAWGAKVPTERNGWSGAMALPRELRLNGGRLVQVPARQMESLRRGEQRFSLSIGAGEKKAIPIESDCLELQLKIRASSQVEATGVRVRCSADGSEFTEIRWSPRDGQLTLDRTHAGESDQDLRSTDYRGDVLELRVFVDRSSVEIFSTDGSIAMTSRVYPSSASRGVQFFAQGGNAHIECTCWHMTPSA